MALDSSSALQGYTDSLVDETKDKLTTTAEDTNTALGALSTPTVDYTAPTTDDIQGSGAVAKDSSVYMTPKTSVASQLSDLLTSNSQYMQQTAAKAKLTANELGMLSSDRYVGAATGAAIREALPIATADAGTATKFGLQQQQSDNQLAATSMEGLVSGSLKKQEAEINAQAQKTKGAIDNLLASSASMNSAELAGLSTNLSTASQEVIKNIDAKIQKDLQEFSYSQQTAENLRQQATTQINNTMITIENTIKNPDLLQLGPEAMAKVVNNEIAIMRGGIELTYNIAKLNIDSYVSDLLAGFEAEYKWA